MQRMVRQARFTSYEEFWPFYLREHSARVTRVLHFTGTTLALGAIIAGILVNPLWLVAALPAGYLFAWAGHLFFERNRPATFSYPLWSLRADFRMWSYMWRGRLGQELCRAGQGRHSETEGLKPPEEPERHHSFSRR
jgi:hypothetical protein